MADSTSNAAPSMRNEPGSGVGVVNCTLGDIACELSAPLSRFNCTVPRMPLELVVRTGMVPAASLNKDNANVLEDREPLGDVIAGPLKLSVNDSDVPNLISSKSSLSSPLLAIVRVEGSGPPVTPPMSDCVPATYVAPVKLKSWTVAAWVVNAPGLN